MSKLNEQERKTELALVTRYAVQNTKYKSLNQLSKYLGVSSASLNNWSEGRTDPLRMNMGALILLLELRGWKLDPFIRYMLGMITKEDLETGKTDLTKEAVNLPLNERAKLMYALANSIVQETNAFSSPEFVATLRRWLDRENLSISEAAQLTRIIPDSRFQGLVDGGLMPSQRELILLTVCGRFTKNDGSGYQLAELEALVAGSN
ncbi:MAG: hypothetical protein AB4372_35030 [Xenococcus sp. (in: cyanobacteria)]